LVDLDEIKKRWGDPEKGSQYYADVHALMDEVERLREPLQKITKSDSRCVCGAPDIHPECVDAYNNSVVGNAVAAGIRRDKR